MKIWSLLISPKQPFNISVTVSFLRLNYLLGPFKITKATLKKRPAIPLVLYTNIQIFCFNHHMVVICKCMEICQFKERGYIDCIQKRSQNSDSLQLGSLFVHLLFHIFCLVGKALSDKVYISCSIRSLHRKKFLRKADY